MVEPGSNEAEGLSASVTSSNTVAEIRAYAADNGIDLAGARTKAQMLAVIEDEEGRN